MFKLKNVDSNQKNESLNEFNKLITDYRPRISLYSNTYTKSFVELTSAPLDSRAFTTSTCPSLEARCNAVFLNKKK